MKYIIALVSIWCVCLKQVHAQDKVNVTAHIKGLKAGYWLHYGPADALEKNWDSVKTIKDGYKLSISLKNGEGDIYTFKLDSAAAGKDTMMNVYLEPGKMVMNAGGPGFKDCRLAGSMLAVQEDEMNQAMKKRSDSARNAMKPGQSAVGMIADIFFYMLNWAKEHPASGYSSVLLYSIAGVTGRLPIIPQDSLNAVYDMLTDHAKQNVPAKKLLLLFGNIRLGEMAKNFSEPDTSGRMVSLKDFRGKYVLLDFWASWCKPCRAENPNVVKAYNRYKDRQFTVLSVSIDIEKMKDKWLEAIRADSMHWTNVSDLKLKNEAAGLYGVVGVPTNYLIDPNGKVIGKNLRGPALEQKLAAVLGN